jgi:hypothetical protein
MFLCVSLYSRCRSACNFVRLGTLLQLSSSNRILFLYSLIHAAQLLPACGVSFFNIHTVVWHFTLFVWVHCYNYLPLTVSFPCTLSYMPHDYYQRTSYQCVTSYAASLPTVLHHTLNSGTELTA